MKYILTVDLEKCVACGACAVACMDQNDIRPEEQEMPFRCVAAIERGEAAEHPILYLSTGCMHCEDPQCVDACPCNCISRDEATGMVVCDNRACIGCHSCALACPFGAPTFDRNGKMRKCDGCYIRIHNGLLPACVRVCPFGALELLTQEEYRVSKSERLIAKILEMEDRNGKAEVH